MHPADQRILDDIAQHGWHVILVGDGERSFGYTIGIHKTFGKPEVFICGLSPNNTHALCNLYGTNIRSGLEYQVGDVAGDWFDTDAVKTAFTKVHDGWKPFYLGKLVDTMNDQSVPVLQAVWSDSEGRFPPEDGFDSTLEGKQFFLNQAPEY